MLCPVVEGAQRAIPLAVRAVYKDSSGQGGLAGELAEKLFEDLEKHGNNNNNNKLYLKKVQLHKNQFSKANLTLGLLFTYYRLLITNLLFKTTH